MKKIKKVFWFAAVLAMVASGFVAMVSADITPESDVKSSSAIIYVPDNYTRIQWAIDNTTDGDTIIVRGGTYYENVVVNKSIILKGIDHPVVDAGKSEDVITIIADNCTIDGFVTIRSELYCSGIKIESDNNLIKNNIVSDNFCGISISNSSNNIITNNNALNNDDTGISLWDSSSNNKLMDNNVSNNRFAIYIDRSSNNTLTNNNASKNGCGILLFAWCENNKLMKNNVLNNGRGICLDYYSSNNELINNNVLNNSGGIYLFYSYNNLIYHNNLINNTNQARDDGNNSWDNGHPSGGNYWSNYTSADNFNGPYQNLTGSDGIGDDPYTTISGGSSVDRYPLMQPWVGDALQKGDLNGDDQITSADAAIALQLAVSGGWDPAADVNGDNIVTAIDALMIIQAVVGSVSL